MIKKHLYLEADTIDILKKYGDENNIKTLSKALNSLVKKYNENYNNSMESINKYIVVDKNTNKKMILLKLIQNKDSRYSN